MIWDLHIWPWNLPSIFEPFYWLIAVGTWRSLTGHWAWSIHRTATNQATLRPPVENWLVASIPAALLAFIWPLVLFFVIPWPRRFTKGDEREGEKLVAGLRYQELLNTIEQGERVTGLVEDNERSRADR